MFELAPGAAEESNGDGDRDAGRRRTGYAGRSTFTLPLTEDGGAIGIDMLTEGKRTRLRKLLSDPRLADVLPGVDRAIGQATATMDPDACGYLYDAIGMVIATIARARGVPDDVAGLLLFTDDEKKALAEPTAKVLAKYVGDFKYQDELLLAMILIATINAKVNAMGQAMKLAAQRAQATAQAAPAA